KLRGPFLNFRSHARELGFAEQKRDAGEIGEKRVAKRAFFARHPAPRAGEAIAIGRGDGDAASVGMFLEIFCDESIEPESALFLGIPPAAWKDDWQAFFGRAGGVFEFEEVVFHEILQRRRV